MGTKARRPHKDHSGSLVPAIIAVQRCGPFLSDNWIFVMETEKSDFFKQS